MLVQISRKSGLPLNQSDIDLYKDQYRAMYDECLSRCGAGSITNQDNIAWSKIDMIKLARMLRTAIFLLEKKFKFVSEIELPNSEESWKNLVLEYGPVTIGARSDNGKLAILIADEQITPIQQ